MDGTDWCPECDHPMAEHGAGDDGTAIQCPSPTPVMDEGYPTVPAEMVARIRNGERHRLAYLLEQDGDALVKYLSDPRDAVKMIAYLLRLEANRTGT